MSQSQTSQQTEYEIEKVVGISLGQNGYNRYRVLWEMRKDDGSEWYTDTNDVPEQVMAQFDRVMEKATPWPVATPDDPWLPFALDLEHSVSHVIRRVWEVAHQNDAIIGAFTLPQFQPEALTILLTWSRERLRCLLCDGVMRSKLRDSKFALRLQDMTHLPRDPETDIEPDRPCIYVIEFCNKYGESPTYRNMQDALEIALDPQSDAYKEYLMKDGKIREKRLQGLKTLNDHYRRITKHLKGEEWNQPCKVPFRDVGYSKNGRKRLLNHYAARASTYLMEMLVGIVKEMGLDQNYRLYGDVIFQCHREEQATIGEALWTHLLGSHVIWGRGFNAHQPGINVNTNKLFQKDWVDYGVKVTYNDSWAANLAAEKEAMAKVYDKQVKLQLRTARLEDEILLQRVKSLRIYHEVTNDADRRLP